MRMHKRWLPVAFLVVVATTMSFGAEQKTSADAKKHSKPEQKTSADAKKYPDPKRFEKSILAFEAKDQKKAPPQGAIVCTGSSSMVGWHGTIEKDLAPLTVVPRGFGGSTMNDALHYADRVVIAYRPRAIVLYEGDNDIAQGIGPEKVRDAFRAFVAKVHERLPDARIYVLAIKPSPSRWKLWPKMAEANKLLEAECGKDKRLTFVSIVEGMLEPDGKPREEIFKADRLHMNEKGYAIWRDKLRPILVERELSFETKAEKKAAAKD